MTATLGAILAVVSETVTASVSWMGEIVNFITANPLVMMFVTFSLIGTGVGLLFRLIRG